MYLKWPRLRLGWSRVSGKWRLVAGKFHIACHLPCLALTLWIFTFSEKSSSDWKDQKSTGRARGELWGQKERATAKKKKKQQTHQDKRNGEVLGSSTNCPRCFYVTWSPTCKLLNTYPQKNLFYSQSQLITFVCAWAMQSI